MYIDTSVLAQQFSQENQSLPQKLQKPCPGKFILIGLLVLASPKLLPGGKGRININQPHAQRPVSILKLTFLLICKRVFN